MINALFLFGQMYSKQKRRQRRRLFILTDETDYRDSVKVRAITSFCCSVVRELKRTA
jgi:hypothetical protein